MCLSIWLPLPSLRKYIFKAFFLNFYFFFMANSMALSVSNPIFPFHSLVFFFYA